MISRLKILRRFSSDLELQELIKTASKVLEVKDV